MTARISNRVLLVLCATLVVAVPVFSQVTVTIGVDDTRLQGGSVNDNPLLNAPDPVQPGSSLSHWDPRATPNLLMEPAINPDLAFLELDITDEQMKDIGWTLTADVMGGGGSTFNIFAVDDGFFDARPFDGAPGNPATTLGEARVNLFLEVFSKWAGTLESDVEVDVIVLWTPLFCDPNFGATLAAAGTTFIYFDDSLPMPDTWYHAALTEALVGFDVTGPVDEGGGDLVVLMNSDIDEGCLGDGTGYYYGLDGNNSPFQIDIAPVILHEVGHGLGFSNFVNETTGVTPQDVPGIYDVYTRDIDQAKTWAEMNNAERQVSAKNYGRVEWTGPNAAAGAQALLETGVPVLEVDAPMELEGTFDIGLAAFGPPVPDGGLTGELACFKDGVPDASPFNGCTPAVNPDELAGKIALIDRGACNFTVKVANAQAAGAIGAVVVNNAGNSPPPLGGTDGSITIPTVGLGRGAGNALRAATCGDDVAFIGNDDRFQATAFFSTDGATLEPAVPVGLTNDTAYFWFFGEDNVELVVKTLDGCPINDNYWVYASGLTDVGVVLTVTDTATGEVKQYINNPGVGFELIRDIGAFGTCP